MDQPVDRAFRANWLAIHGNALLLGIDLGAQLTNGVSVDRNPAAPGFRFADRRAIISVEDEPQIDRLAAAERVDGIIAPGIDWPVAIAVVDGSGYLVAFSRLDNTQLGSIEVALEKAKTAALFRRPTKAFEDVLAMAMSLKQQSAAKQSAGTFRSARSA